MYLPSRGVVKKRNIKYAVYTDGIVHKLVPLELVDIEEYLNGQEIVLTTEEWDSLVNHFRPY